MESQSVLQAKTQAETPKVLLLNSLPGLQLISIPACMLGHQDGYPNLLVLYQKKFPSNLVWACTGLSVSTTVIDCLLKVTATVCSGPTFQLGMPQVKTMDGWLPAYLSCTCREDRLWRHGSILYVGHYNIIIIIIQVLSCKRRSFESSIGPGNA